MSLISKYTNKVLPKGPKTKLARYALAQDIKVRRRAQHAGTGPNVRKALVNTIGKRVRKAMRIKGEKTARLAKTQHTMTIQASLKKKRARYKGMKATSINAGAGGGRKPSAKKASLLQNFVHHVSRV